MSGPAAGGADPGGAAATTRAAYDADAEAYAAATSALTDTVRARLDLLADELRPGARVLEIGSGSGRDADHLERRGLSVRRTDVTPGFVDLLCAAGHRAEVLDPLVDDLVDTERHGAPHDGVWANACLLHVARADLPVVLRRLAEVTRSGGVLACSVKAGDGELWSTHGAVSAPRRFVLWRPEPLTTALEDAGWRVDELTEADGQRGERWLMVTARRLGRPGGRAPTSRCRPTGRASSPPRAARRPG